MASQFKNIQLKRGTKEDFSNLNPKLMAGEPAFALDSNQLKIGNGINRWNDLPSFTASRIESSTVSLPAIQGNTSYTARIAIDSINAQNEYAVICVPDSAIPDYVDIRYAYVSNNNEISVVFTNIDHSSVDGNASSNYSAASNVKVHLLVFLVSEFSVTTTTTTTPDPIIDDAMSFGYNEFGQLSLKDKINRLEPTLIFDNNRKWTSFDLGGYHTLAIDKEQNLHSVGYNYYGQLGLENNGVGTNRTSFEQISNVYFSDNTIYASGHPKTFSKISAGSHHSLAISSGLLFSCGDGSYGATGLGNTLSKNKFTLVGEQYDFFDLQRLTSSGINVIDNIFTLNDSEDNDKFIANNGVYIISGIQPNEAITFINDHTDNPNIVSYSGGTLEQSHNGNNYYSDYLLIDVSGDYGYGSLYSMSNGYLSNGTNLIHYKNPNTGWSSVSAGHHHSIGVKDGDLYAWGHNVYGQVGDGDNRDVLRPKKINDTQTWVNVSAGNNHSLAIDSSGNVYCFGDNQYGQLGLGSQSHYRTPTLLQFDFSQIQDDNFTILPSGSNASVVNDLYVFNSSENSEYNPLERFVLSSGQYVISGVPPEHPIAVLNLGKENDITYTGTTSAGCLDLNETTADGRYEFYYGNIYINVLGDFNMVSTYSLNKGYMGGKNIFFYEKPSYKVVNISAGANHTLLRTDTKQALTFGRNHKGQLGTGDLINRSVPYRLSENNIDEISAGTNHSLLRDSQNYIWSFGDNDNGQLGLGDKIIRKIPTQMQSDTFWRRVHAGGDHSIASVLSYYPNIPINFQVFNSDTSNLVGNRQLIITWDHPTALDEAVTHYIVEHSIDNGLNWVVFDNNALSGNFSGANPRTQNLSYILDGLDNNKTYLVRIAPVNSVGVGYYASSSQGVSPKEAIDDDFNLVALYSHMDEGNVDDLSNNSWPFVSGFLTNIDNEGTRYLDGEFSEALRLYRWDSFGYRTNISLDAEYTVEFFFNPRGGTDSQEARIVELKNNTESFLKIIYDGDELSGYRLQAIRSNGQNVFPNNIIFDPDRFAHIAIVRTSGDPIDPQSIEVMQLFLDGTLVGSGRDLNTYDITDVVFGSGNDYAYDYEIDEFRISSGVRYVNDFTVTTKPFGIGLS